MLNVSVIFLLTHFSIATVHSAGLREIFTWTRINYEWPEQFKTRSAYFVGGLSESPGDKIIFEGDTNREEAKYSGSNYGGSGNQNHNVMPNNPDYVYMNNLPMGANVWRNKLFITVPRRRLGIPSTLNFVPLNSKNRHNVPLIPYPSWNMNRYDSKRKEGLVSVYRIAIDECDRLWFVDTGIVETMGNKTIVKPHELVIINLKTDKVISKHVFPDNVLTPATILTQLTIDTSKENCGDAYSYFPDLSGNGLVVFSLKKNKFWRVSHDSFQSEPLARQLNIAGHSFEWKDGIFSIQLSAVKPDGFRDVYFHALAATRMYRVSSKVLKNEQLATRSDHGNDFVLVGNKGPDSQSSSGDIHKPTGILFLGMVNQNAVACWNTNYGLNTLSIVHKDDENMIYPSDVKISGNSLYVLTNTMPRFIYGSLDYDQVNFRVWSNSVHNAVRGTRCQKKN